MHTGSSWLEKRPTLETEGVQIGLEWGRLVTRRVLKNSKGKPKKNFRIYLE